MASCIRFQILVLAHTAVKGSVAPSLQAPIQLYMPASVLCSTAADLFAFLFPCAVLVSVSHRICYSLCWLSDGALTFQTHLKQKRVPILPDKVKTTLRTMHPIALQD